MSYKFKKVLDTDIVKINQSQEGFHTFIKMQDGGWIEMAAFENDLKGLVNALDLATNAAAGKFYPRRLGSKAISIGSDRLKLENLTSV